VTGPHWTTVAAFAKEVSKALDRMTFEEKAAWRFHVSMKHPELRRRILN